ncbi:hypothetical protein [Kribbella catacumbae]|uniref:hypothetical protein n=1 Tax=Kribbella catacumbae TaxID=460086 RepID=UPI0012FA3029|nr:hypothetical protein [Kribbella catacumbae]
MEDTREVSAELHRLADTEPLDHFDTGTVLTRGRRGLRRRRLLGAGGAVAGVAAAALAVTVIPNLITSGNNPGVAGTQTENSQFSPVPGIPRGEDGAGQRISKQEAERRCALRNPGPTYPLEEYTGRSAGFRSVSARSYDVRKDPRSGNAGGCVIPGGDKPSAALVAAAKADPFPKNAADQLRNCSVRAWVDMTKWRIQVSDRLDEPREGMYPAFTDSLLIAISPSGKTAVACQLQPAGIVGMGKNRGGAITAVRLDDLGTDDPRMEWPDGTLGKEIATMILGSSDCNDTGKVCARSLPLGWGQAPADTAKVVVQVGSGPKYEAPLKDGWFAFTALDKTPHTEADRMTVRSYDKDGKLLSKLYPEK